MAKRNFQDGKNAGKVADVIRNSNMSGNAATAVDLDINKIDENPDNETIFDMSGIEQLAREIEEFGFTGAIDVYQKEDGRYELSSGHRRYRAVKLLGRTTIPAIIKPMPSDLVRRHMLIHSNTMNRVLSYMDMARAIKYERETFIMEMAQEKGVRWHRDKDGDLQANIEMSAVTEQLCKTFNMSNTQIYRYLALLKVNDGIVSLLEEKRIPLKPIITIAKCSKESQTEIYEALKTELSVWGGDKDNPSTLSQEQCNSIIKKIARKNHEGINENSDFAYSGTTKYKEPLPIDFDSVDGDSIISDPQMNVQPISFAPDSSEKGEINYSNISEESVHPVVSAETQQIYENDEKSDHLAKLKEVLEAEPEPEPEPVYHNYIDNTIIMFTNQISFFIKNEYDIQDKIKLSENIEMLEDILNQIKEKL